MKKWIKPLCLMMFCALGSTDLQADAVILKALDRKPFDQTCQYDVYYSPANTTLEVKSVAKFVSSGYLVFDSYNTLRLYPHTYVNEKGVRMPARRNQLPVKTYAIHYLSKSMAFPFSVQKTVEKEETGMAAWDEYPHHNGEEKPYLDIVGVYLEPSGGDTMSDIVISHIVRNCSEIRRQQ